jgi:predicted nucleic-acid-binding protein
MASKKESLDTNILLRLILKDIPAQYDTAIKLLNRKEARFDVADLAITETVYVLETAHKATRPEVSEAITAITTLPNLNCNRALFSEVLPFYLTHPKLSFTDCCLAEYARQNQSEPLWTFDKKLALQSGTAKIA